MGCDYIKTIHSQAWHIILTGSYNHNLGIYSNFRKIYQQILFPRLSQVSFQHVNECDL